MPLQFFTPTLLDPMAFTVMGLSAKTQSDSIGRFGTGLKYAIAGTHRLGGTMRIWCGREAADFRTREAEFRGKTIQLLEWRAEGAAAWAPLPFTTELGKHWQSWMLLRELWSNTKDEGGFVSTAKSLDHGEDSTLIEVDWPGIEAEWDSRDTWLLSARPDLGKPIDRNEQIEVYSGKSTAIYYQGIKVYTHSSKPFRYTYNLLGNVPLTEDREMSSTVAEIYLARGIAELTNSGVHHSVLLDTDDVAENDLNWSWVSDLQNKPIMKIAQTLVKSRRYDMHKYWLKTFFTNQDPTECEVTPSQQAEVLRIRTILHAAGFGHAGIPIKFSNSLGEDIYGVARNGEVWIDPRCFKRGEIFLASTLLEEFVHIQTGHNDLTRELQTWLFDQIAETVMTKDKTS